MDFRKSSISGKENKEEAKIAELKISEKLDNSNPLKHFLYSLEYKKQNKIFFKMFSFIFLFFWIILCLYAKTFNIELMMMTGFEVYFIYIYNSKLVFPSCSNEDYNIFSKKLERLFFLFFVVVLVIVFLHELNVSQNQEKNIGVFNLNMIVLGGIFFINACIFSNIYSIYERYIRLLKSQSINVYILGIFNIFVIPFFMMDVYFRILNSHSKFILFLAFVILFFSLFFFISYIVFLFVALLRILSLKLNRRNIYD